jgi:hypothetical protein
MESISPVYNENFVECETVVALDQPEYKPIIALHIENVGASLVRFEFTEEERRLIAEGADLIVCELTFNRPFTPIGLEITPKGQKPNMVDLEKR